MQNARLVAGHLRKLPHASDLDGLRGEEGDSARLYFQSLQYLIRTPARSDFAFDTRNRRPPTDPMNAMLSFLYAVVLNDCRSALETVGLDPQLERAEPHLLESCCRRLGEILVREIGKRLAPPQTKRLVEAPGGG